jgi:hypothetical protein
LKKLNSKRISGTGVAPNAVSTHGWYQRETATFAQRLFSTRKSLRLYHSILFSPKTNNLSLMLSCPVDGSTE